MIIARRPFSRASMYCHLSPRWLLRAFAVWSAASVVALAQPDVYDEPFETLAGVHFGGGARVELSADVVHEGRHSLKIVATVNPQDALVFKQDKEPLDLSKCNALSLWVYPETLDGTFAVEVRMCVWDATRKRGKWFTLGNLSNRNAPNRQWSRHCFYLGDIPRNRVLRVFDMVAWHHAGAYRKGERLTLYLDDLHVFSAPLSRDGVLLNGGFEGELIPWRVSGDAAAGQIVRDTKARAQGESSVRVEAIAGKPSPKVTQTAKVSGGAWFAISGWLRTKEANRAQLTLAWSRADSKPVMRTYVRSTTQVLDVSGDHEFTWFRKVVCAPENAQRCAVTLSTNGGVAWFDGLAMRPVDDGAQRFRWLYMPPKHTILWREHTQLPLRQHTESLASVRIAFVPSPRQTLAVSLTHENGSLPLLRIRRGAVTVCDGGEWRELPWLLGKNRSVVICASARRGAFDVTTCGLVFPWQAPFRFAARLPAIRGVSFDGEGALSRVLVEGPLWKPADFDARRRTSKRMSIVMRKDVGWMVPEKELPADLHVEASPPSAWREKAVILHTGLPFNVLLANLERLHEMKFNTICLRPIQPTGRIGFGSSCCIQSYTTLSPVKGTAEELRTLVQRVHELGMRILFWLVPNHASPSNEAFQTHPELLFADAGLPRSQWFDVLDFDYGNPQTWRFMANVAEYWVKEFDFDGFGVDVPDLLPRNFLRYLKRRLLDVKGGDVFILGESSGAHIEEWGMDCRYGFLSMFQMREILEGVVPPPKPPQRVIARLVQRLYPHETWEAFGPFGANMGLKRFLDHYGEGPTKCAAALMTTLPFVPEVFAGAELLALHDERDAIGLTTRMLRLRAAHPAMRSHQVQMLAHDHPDLACAYLKRAREEVALVVINFRDRLARLTIDLDADAAAALRNAPLTDLLTGSPVRLEWAGTSKLRITLPPFGIALHAAPRPD